MRRLLLVLSLVALALVAAGCFPTAGPAWTYAPPTPTPTVDPSASIEPSPSVVPSVAPSVAPSQPASAAPSVASAAPVVLQLSAFNVQFDQSALAAPANTAFTIHLSNKDTSIQHNVEIKDASGMTMYKGDLSNGPSETDFPIPPLPAGAYTFNCTLHPNTMTGTLTVGP